MISTAHSNLLKGTYPTEINTFIGQLTQLYVLFYELYICYLSLTSSLRLVIWPLNLVLLEHCLQFWENSQMLPLPVCKFMGLFMYKYIQVFYLFIILYPFFICVSVLEILTIWACLVRFLQKLQIFTSICTFATHFFVLYSYLVLFI